VPAQEIVTRGHYSLKKVPQPGELVKAIDLDVMRNNHLPKYELQSKTEDKNGVKRMVVYNKESQKKIEIRITLLPSVDDANNNILDLLNGTSVLLNDGTPSGHAIGDNSWYHTTKETGATGILFVRKNAVISIFAQDGSVADTLARKLDEDILASRGNNGGMYQRSINNIATNNLHRIGVKSQ
jgi:hypothetical protein